MVKAAKLIISVWLVYHLFIILLFPNTQSLLSRKLDRFLLPYANSLNMNTPWQFFSPFPGPKFYIEYEVSNTQTSENGDLQVEGKKYFYPSQDQRDPDWDNFRRRLYSARFVSVDPQRLKDVFIPWVCRQHPGAMMVSAEVIMAPVPNIEKAQTYSRISEMETPQTSFKVRGDCEKQN